MSAFPRFVAAGEALTDMLRSSPAAWTSQEGGSTWNVARVMARLGVASAFAGAVSTDVFGAALAAANAEAGLDARFLQQVDKAPLLAFVHELNPPSYFFVGADSADLYFDDSLLPAGWEAQAACVHFGGISLAREPLAGKLLALAARLKAAGVLISYDPNFRSLMTQAYDPVLRAMTALAGVIKVSDDDLRGLFRHDDTAAGLATIRAWNPGATVLFTRGADGASLYCDGAVWNVQAPAVAVRDTVGAGDASMGGLLYSLLSRPQASASAHLRFAVAAGAAACMEAGAAPPSPARVHALYELTSATRSDDESIS